MARGERVAGPDRKTGKELGNEWVAIAKLIRPRGRAGELIAESLTDFPERFTGLKHAFLENPSGPPRAVGVRAAWWHDDRLFLAFDGVESIEAAEGLRSLLVLVPTADRVALGADRYYVSELIGCAVVRIGSDEPLGVVARIEPTGGVDVLAIQPPEFSGRETDEILIPLARAICLEIDVARRRIVIDPPEGLLELNTGSAEPEK